MQVLAFLAPHADRGEDTYGYCEEGSAWKRLGFAEYEMLCKRGDREKRDRYHDYEQDKT